MNEKYCSILTKAQAVPGKLPFAAIILKQIILLVQGTLIRVNDDGWTHLVVSWLLKVRTYINDMIILKFYPKLVARCV